MMQPQRQKRLYEEVTAQLHALVQGGDFRPGDRLPPERQLAMTFKVSRNCVREAIKSLEQQGLVVSRPGAGTYIAHTSQASLTVALGEILTRERYRLADIFELRLLLEPQIARLAAERITARDRAALEKLAADYAAALESGADVVPLDQQFHDAIAAATGNHAVIRLMDTMQDLLRESRDEALQSPTRHREALEDHVRILDALGQGDPDLAQSAMTTHLLHTRAIVFTSTVEKNHEGNTSHRP